MRKLSMAICNANSNQCQINVHFVSLQKTLEICLTISTVTTEIQNYDVEISGGHLGIQIPRMRKKISSADQLFRLHYIPSSYNQCQS